MVKPPRRSIITGVHMAEKMYLVASLGSSRWCGFSSARTTCRTTARKGTKSEVTNKGIAYTQQLDFTFWDLNNTHEPQLPIAG